jgi:hypothetical protein
MDKASLFKLSGLPDSFGVLLLSFSFILLLAPYFSGADFGLFKIPVFTESAKKWLKIVGPIFFAICLLSFVPFFQKNDESKGKEVSPTHSPKPELTPSQSTPFPAPTQSSTNEGERNNSENSTADGTAANKTRSSLRAMLSITEVDAGDSATMDWGLHDQLKLRISINGRNQDFRLRRAWFDSTLPKPAPLEVSVNAQDRVRISFALIHTEGRNIVASSPRFVIITPQVRLPLNGDYSLYSGGIGGTPPSGQVHYKVRSVQESTR